MSNVPKMGQLPTPVSASGGGYLLASGTTDGAVLIFDLRTLEKLGGRGGAVGGLWGGRGGPWGAVGGRGGPWLLQRFGTLIQGWIRKERTFWILYMLYIFTYFTWKSKQHILLKYFNCQVGSPFLHSCSHLRSHTATQTHASNLAILFDLLFIYPNHWHSL